MNEEDFEWLLKIGELSEEEKIRERRKGEN